MGLIGSILAGAIAVIFAVLMILQRSLYAAALCLLVVLLQASVIFYFSGSPLLAFLQIMIYAGAVMVLVVVTIMAAPSPSDKLWNDLSIPKPLAIAGLLLPLIEAGIIASRGGFSSQTPELVSQAQEGMGKVLFGPYAIATEAAALLLFLSALAMIGKPGRKNTAAP